MDFFLCAISFIVAFFVLVLVHEAGHFLGAILFGVRVEKVSIGFGKPFYRWKKGKNTTEYVVAPIILGGYVEMQSLKEFKLFPPYNHSAFNDKSLFSRLSIILLGPIANIIFAFFAFWLMFMIGFKSPKPIISKVASGSIASISGMMPGEEILKIDGVDTSTWSRVSMAMIMRLKEKGSLKITTSKKDYYLNLATWNPNNYSPTPLNDFGLIAYKPFINPVIYKAHKGSSDSKWKKFGYLGAGIDTEKINWPKKMIREHKYSPLAAFNMAIDQIKIIFKLNTVIFTKMLFGEISFGIFSGPLSVFVTSGKAIQGGFAVFLGFLAMMSLSIAMVNFLPLPGLDCGHFFMILYESISRKTFSVRMQKGIFRLGITVFIFLVIRTTANDLIRLFV